MASTSRTPPQVAKIVRHRTPTRTGEIRLRFVRDTAFREDASKVRTGYGPENMATLRSFAINQLSVAHHTNIAAALREMSLRPLARPLTLLGGSGQ